MKFIRHLFEQPFISATGAAALVHSTWSLGTFFAGEQPEGWHLLGWLIPALLIAFALDVGQIATSMQIRERGLTIARFSTFVVFSVATYYLQWLYIAHHMPAMPLSAGISAAHQDAALALRDLAIWLIPALLPLSTLLYTFSSEDNHQSGASDEPIITVDPITGDDGLSIALPDKPLPMLPVGGDDITTSNDYGETLVSAGYVLSCEYCGEWSCEPKGSLTNARRALAMHQTRHCEKAMQHANA